jgi:hypothetical protein
MREGEVQKTQEERGNINIKRKRSRKQQETEENKDMMKETERNIGEI